jgi:hypothetical protein
MLSPKARYLLVAFPFKAMGLGLIAGALSYVFLGLVTELSSAQRAIALLGWPIILVLYAFYSGAKEYRRLK